MGRLARRALCARCCEPLAAALGRSSTDRPVAATRVLSLWYVSVFDVPGTIKTADDAPSGDGSGGRGALLVPGAVEGADDAPNEAGHRIRRGALPVSRQHYRPRIQNQHLGVQVGDDLGAAGPRQ